MPSQQETIALKYLSGFKTLDPTIFESVCTQTCSRTFAPASMDIPDKSPAEFHTHIENLSQVLSGFEVNVKECFWDEEKKAIVVWATGEAVFRHEDCEYQGEYVFMFWFEGNKICRVVEMADSKATEKLIGMLLGGKAESG